MVFPAFFLAAWAPVAALSVLFSWCVLFGFFFLSLSFDHAFSYASFFFDRFSDALQSFSSFHLLRLSWFCRWVIVLYCFLWVAFSWWLCIACLAMFVVCDSFFIWSSDASSSSVYSCLCSVLCLSFYLLFFGVGTLALSTNCLIISLFISLSPLASCQLFCVSSLFSPAMCEGQAIHGIRWIGCDCFCARSLIFNLGLGSSLN